MATTYRIRTTFGVLLLVGTLAGCTSASAPSPTVAPIAATVSASEPVRVGAVNLSSQDSTITLQNAGAQAADLSGWSVQVGSARATLPTGVNVAPGQSVTVHTAAGSNTASDVYLGQDAQAITGQLKPGVQVVVENPAGSPMTSFIVPNG